MASPIKPDDTIWTPANIVTIIRICGVPVFVASILLFWPQWIPGAAGWEPWKPWVATFMFVILAATDGLDGYLARSRNEVTNFGKFVDPLADKILTTAALLVLIELHVLPSWPVIIILTREFIVAGIRMVAATQNVVIAASWYGKAKTVSQMIAIVLFFIKDSDVIVDSSPSLYSTTNILAWVAMIVALFFTIVSMCEYFSKSRELLGFKPRKSARMQHEVVELDSEAVSEICEDAYATSIEDASRALLDAARRAGVRLGFAESLTGGMIAASMTAHPGASDVVAGGIVSYSVQAKRDLLGVPEDLFDSHPVVSEPIAQAMAEGCRRRLHVDYAVAVTGVAGPGSDEQGIAAGTVAFALAGPKGTHCETRVFRGERHEVQEQCTLAALALIAQNL